MLSIPSESKWNEKKLKRCRNFFSECLWLSHWMRWRLGREPKEEWMKNAVWKTKDFFIHKHIMPTRPPRERRREGRKADRKTDVEVCVSNEPTLKREALRMNEVRTWSRKIEEGRKNMARCKHGRSDFLDDPVRSCSRSVPIFLCSFVHNLPKSLLFSFFFFYSRSCLFIHSRSCLLIHSRSCLFIHSLGYTKYYLPTFLKTINLVR